MTGAKAGAALPMALFALCLIGALTVGGAFVARRSVDDARVDQKAMELSPAAEQALGDVVGTWGADGPPDLAVGATAPVAVSVAGEARVEVWVTRLGATLYWLVSDASRTRKPLLHKRMGILILADSLGVRTAPQAAWFDLP